MRSPWKTSTLSLLLLQLLTLPGLSLKALALEINPVHPRSAGVGLNLPGSWSSSGPILPHTEDILPPPPPPNFPQGSNSGASTTDPQVAQGSDTPGSDGSAMESDTTEIILSQSNGNTIPAGTRIQAIYPDAERIVVTPDETMDLTLEVTETVRSATGVIVIPMGSQVEGRLEPRSGGTQFVAQRLILAGTGQTSDLDARSEVVTTTEEIREGTDTGAILRGAAIGAAAATAVDLIMGDGKIGLGTILVGATLGAGAGWALDGRKQATVLVVDAAEDLDLTLDSALVLATPSQ